MLNQTAMTFIIGGVILALFTLTQWWTTRNLLRSLNLEKPKVMLGPFPASVNAREWSQSLSRDLEAILFEWFANAIAIAHARASGQDFLKKVQDDKSKD